MQKLQNSCFKGGFPGSVSFGVAGWSVWYWDFSWSAGCCSSKARDYSGLCTGSFTCWLIEGKEHCTVFKCMFPASSGFCKCQDHRMGQAGKDFWKASSPASLLKESAFTDCWLPLKMPLNLVPAFAGLFNTCEGGFCSFSWRDIIFPQCHRVVCQENGVWDVLSVTLLTVPYSLQPHKKCDIILLLIAQHLKSLDMNVFVSLVYLLESSLEGEEFEVWCVLRYHCAKFIQFPFSLVCSLI